MLKDFLQLVKSRLGETFRQTVQFLQQKNGGDNLWIIKEIEETYWLSVMCSPCLDEQTGCKKEEFLRKCGTNQIFDDIRKLIVMLEIGNGVVILLKVIHIF